MTRLTQLGHSPSALFDHPVGATEQRERESDSERLGGLEVDVELDFCGLLDRQIGWFFALENAAGVDASQAVVICNAASVTHQATGGDERPMLIDRGHRM